MAWDSTITEERPGVLVSHAWAGRGEFEENKAAQLAELGYVGFAIDLYGKGVRGTSPEENGALMQPFLDDRVILQSRLSLALGVLKKQKEVDSARVAPWVTVLVGFVYSTWQESEPISLALQVFTGFLVRREIRTVTGYQQRF